MTFEELSTVLQAGGMAKRVAWGDEFVKFRNLNRPSHTDMLRGSVGEEAVASYYLSSDDIMAEDWEIVA